MSAAAFFPLFHLVLFLASEILLVPATSSSQLEWSVIAKKSMFLAFFAAYSKASSTSPAPSDKFVWA